MFILFILFFFFNNPATTVIYTLSLHDALPICPSLRASREHGWNFSGCEETRALGGRRLRPGFWRAVSRQKRSEEHTSELQSHHELVCRLLLEKKKRLIVSRPCRPRHLLNDYKK